MLGILREDLVIKSGRFKELTSLMKRKSFVEHGSDPKPSITATLRSRR
jgi:hypothetical protein